MADTLDDIFDDEALPPGHRSGVVAIVGRPNVGKSTLINAVLGQKIAIATPKPQTTRTRQLGIYTTPQVQMLLMDTPGIHKPFNTLSDYMMRMVDFAFRDADVLLWIVDLSLPPTEADGAVAERLLNASKPVIVALNKLDIAPQAHHAAAYSALVPDAAVLKMSAVQGQGITELLGLVADRLPEGPRYYPIDQTSDANMRFVAAEIIREQILLHTEKEIPYATAVEITGYQEGEERTTIEATIYIERDSQKGIIIGAKGSMLKAIGTAARKELMEMLDAAVHLDLHVKVLKEWRSDAQLMKRLGYRMPTEDDD